MFTVAQFTIAKIWKQSYCPSTDEWIKKMYMLIRTENGIPLRHLKNEIIPFAAAWVNLGLTY